MRLVTSVRPLVHRVFPDQLIKIRLPLPPLHIDTSAAYGHVLLGQAPDLLQIAMRTFGKCDVPGRPQYAVPRQLVSGRQFAQNAANLARSARYPRYFGNLPVACDPTARDIADRSDHTPRAFVTVHHSGLRDTQPRLDFAPRVLENGISIKTVDDSLHDLFGPAVSP